MGEVGEITASLVREYLSRKGLKNTLKTLDDELPRTTASISNRAQLAKEIHIERLMKKNKDSEEAFRTMLEVIVQFMRDRERHPSSEPSSSRTGPSRPSSRLGYREGGAESNDLRSSSSQSSDKEKNISGKSKSGLDVDFLTKRTHDHHEDTPVSPTKNKIGGRDYFNIASPNNEKDTNFFPVSNVGRSVNRIKSPVLSKSAEIPNNENTILNSDMGVRGSSKRNRGRLGMGSSGPIMSSGLGGMKEGRGHTRRKQHLSNPEINKSLSLSIDDDIKMETEESTLTRKSGRGEMNRDHKVEDKKKSNKQLNNEIPSPSFEPQKTKPSFLQPTRQAAKSTSDELLFEDVDDDLGEELANVSLGVPRDTLTAEFTREDITLETARDLKNLIFGVTSASFSPEWSKQGFAFTDAPGLEYGIIQHKGGPCGVLASVQATVLKHLMMETRAESRSLQPSPSERNNALALCLSEMVWRCGENKKAVIVLPSMGAKFIGGARYKVDGITESLTVYSFKKQESVLLFIRQNLSQFQDGSGVVLLLYSAILSRTVPKVKSDMDEPSGKLLGAHGYCTQEMVNLLLTGKAHSNVFDNTVKLDHTMVLRGLQKQNDIGLLSLFEHYGSCEVGSFYKTPKFPIWVVCSESHFSVLFINSVNFFSDRRQQRKFDLFYFDGLARQDEEIRLTVDTTRSPDYSDGDLVPPLEHCIRTKWKDAFVDWNGSDPIL